MSQELETNKGGVKTDEGKAISRYNAQKHAILRETITDYEKADAEELYNELAVALNPSGRFQELLVENLAANAIRLLRIAKAEAEFFKETLNPDLRPLALGGYNPQVNSGSVEKLELYSRYQTATENRMYRALGMLKHLKTYEQS